MSPKDRKYKLTEHVHGNRDSPETVLEYANV